MSSAPVIASAVLSAPFDDLGGDGGDPELDMHLDETQITATEPVTPNRDPASRLQSGDRSPRSAPRTWPKSAKDLFSRRIRNDPGASDYRSTLDMMDAALAAHLTVLQSKTARSVEQRSSDGEGGAFGRTAVLGQHIPWYIIDPTGEFINEQRSIAAAKRKPDGSRNQLAFYLFKMPTLQPYWDMLTGVALIFTALVTPFEVGFLPPSTNGSDPLFIINRLIDTVFIIDMVLQFFTMKPVTIEKAMEAQVEWEMDLRVLARDYMTGWFVIDVASIAPSALDFLPVIMSSQGSSNTEEGEGETEGTGGLRVFRTLRALRLIKLMRLAKSSRVIARLMDYVTMSCTAQEIVSTAVQALVLTHWVACMLMIATTFAETPLETWLATFGYCTPDEEMDEGFRILPTGFLYLKTWKWSLGLIFHNTLPVEPDHGPFEPYFAPSNEYKQQLTTSEEVIVILLKLFGIGFWSLAVSKIIRSVTTLGNPASIAYSQDLDSVNRFCEYNRLPSWLARELRRYVRKTREVHEQRARNDIYSKLSPLLVIKITKLLNRTLVDSRFVKKASASLSPIEGERFVSALVIASTTAVFSPGDRPPARRLYIITEGIVMHDTLGMLGIGDCWGDQDVLLAIQSAAWNRAARAVTYLRVLCLSRHDFQRFHDEFPEAFKALRSVAVFKRARSILQEVCRDPDVVNRLRKGLLLQETSRTARAAAGLSTASDGDDDKPSK